jgi:hypothetical protein
VNQNIILVEGEEEEEEEPTFSCSDNTALLLSKSECRSIPTEAETRGALYASREPVA